MLLRTFLMAAVLMAPLFPESPVSTHPLQKALILFNAGKYQECLEVVSPYVAQNPESGAGHKLLGMAKYMLGTPREALAEVLRATELTPNDADAFYYLGRLYFSEDNAIAALAALQQSVKLNPLSVRARNQLGQTQEALGRHGDAERAYLQAIELQSNAAKKSEWPYYNLGLLYYHNGRPEDAVIYLRRALECNPDFAEAKVKLAAILAKQNMTSEALRLLQDALQSDPGNSEGHYRLGMLLIDSGKPAAGERELALFEKYRKR